MPQIRVLIADDHALVRSGLRALLAAQPDIEVVGEAEDGAAVVEQCERLKPDVALMDLTMPGRGGILAAEEIARACPATKVLVLTMHEDEAYARQARLAGAAGYVLKKALATELIQAIRTVHGGKHYISLSVANAFAEPELLPWRKHRPDAGVELLSEREREVVSLVALGHTNAEMADKLHISEKTVETHRAHALEKLGLRTRADLVRFAIEHGLMSR
jgi:two-component system response regulator NreC